jgi:hypothetical protein
MRGLRVGAHGTGTAKKPRHRGAQIADSRALRRHSLTAALAMRRAVCLTRGMTEMACFDEMTGPGGVRPPYADIARWLEALGPEARALKRAEAEALFRGSASPSRSMARAATPSG